MTKKGTKKAGRPGDKVKARICQSRVVEKRVSVAR